MHVQMKTAKLLIAALVALSSLPLLAQQADPAAQTNPAAASPAANGQASASQSAAVDTQMQPVKSELVSKLDTKTAKDGDNVVVKTKEPLKTASGALIPKGSRLVGHVIDVQAHGKGTENSKVAIKFDHAELKGGQNLAIHSVIESVSPSQVDSAMTGQSSFGGAPMAGAPAGGGGAGAMGGSRTGGGAAQSTPSAGAGPAAGPVTVGQADNNGAPPPGTIVAGSGDNVIRTTAIPGVFLASNRGGQGQSSGTLFGAKMNVRLDEGTQMVLGVSEATSQ